jgi:hypothetical protein
VVGTIPIILVAAVFVLVVLDGTVDATKLTLEVIVLIVTAALDANSSSVCVYKRHCRYALRQARGNGNGNINLGHGWL